MTVGTFKQPDFTSQDPTTYKGDIDGSFAALVGIAGQFAPHQQTSANMTVVVDAGSVLNGTTLTSQAQQSTGNIAAPSVHPRIDRVVIDTTTGAVSVVTGVEANSPSAPALTTGKAPVCQVLLQTTSTVITNSMIVDERNFYNNSVLHASDVNGYTANVASGGNAVNIWQNTATVQMTGTGNTTGFANAPSIGAQCRIITTDACLFTAGANLLIEGIPSGTTITLAANAIVDVTAITTTQFKMTYSLSGTFTATCPDITGSPTGTAKFSVRNGICSLYIPYNTFTGSSVNTSLTITGLPTCIVPVTVKILPPAVGIDNSTAAILYTFISGGSSVLSFSNGIASNVFTGSGTKAIKTSEYTYSLH